MSEVFNVEEIFAKNVFTVGKMKQRLPKGVFKEVKKAMEEGKELSLATADVVAKAMKGSRKGGYPLHPLVSAADGNHGGKA